MAAEDERRDKAPTRPSTGGALLWTAASLPLPGVAHLRMRRRFAGTVILGAYLAGIAALALWAFRIGTHESGAMTALAGMAVRDHWLLGVMGAVFAVVVLIAAKLIRDRRAHKGGCGCGCEGCASAGLCHPPKR